MTSKELGTILVVFVGALVGGLTSSLMALVERVESHEKRIRELESLAELADVADKDRARRRYEAQLRAEELGL